MSFKQLTQVSWWTIVIHYRMSKSYTIAKFIFVSIDMIANLASAYLLGRLLDSVIDIATSETNSPQEMIPNLLMYLGFMLAIFAISIATRFTSNRLYYIKQMELPRLIYTKIDQLGVQRMESPKVQKLLDTTNREMHDISNYVNQIMYALGSFTELILAGIIIYTINPILFLILIVSVFPLVISDNIFSKKDWAVFKKHQDETRKAQTYEDSLRATEKLPEIFINKTLSVLDSKYLDIRKTYYDDEKTVSKQWTIAEFLSSSVSRVALVIGYFLTYSKLLLGSITIGDTTFYISTINRVRSSVEMLGFRFAQIYQRAIRFQEAYEFFHLQPQDETDKKEIQPFTEPPEIKIKDLDFNYPNTDITVLKDISLNIKPGEKIAIVGHNGAGKTTLIKLISKLYEYNTGDIQINGDSLNNITTRSWHDNLGVLFQEYNFYSTLTAKENIQVGRPDEKPNKKDIINAAKMADAHDFITDYPNGYDTLLDEKYDDGIRPSTGQKQKIAIARFFYRNSPVVIFDEPTAAIDAVSEYKIFNRIYKFFENKTVIIISHRFSTVRNADRILVMDKGQITEEGSHDNLMKQNGEYAKAFKLQAEGYQQDPQLAGKSQSDNE